MRGERGHKSARAVTENGAFLTPFEKDYRGGFAINPSTSPPLAKGGLRGDLPLRDKERLSESSISKTPTAYQWGQIPQPHCVRQLPLLKGATLRSTALFTFCHFDRSIVFSLALAQNRGFCAKEERQRSEVASRVYAACLERSLARRVEKSRSASDGQKGSVPLHHTPRTGGITLP